MSSVTTCVGGGLFICFTCLHVPYSTVTLITLSTSPEGEVRCRCQNGMAYND
jgi:hypothetical protein